MAGALFSKRLLRTGLVVSVDNNSWCFSSAGLSSVPSRARLGSLGSLDRDPVTTQDLSTAASLSAGALSLCYTASPLVVLCNEF